MAEPIQYNLIDGAIYAAVLLDHMPRQAQYLTKYSDGSVGETTHMIFWDESVVRSCLIENWPAEQITIAKHQQDRNDAVLLRQQVLTIAQSAVGVPFDRLLVDQLRALVGILLWKANAIDKSGAVRPLDEWI